MDKSTVALFTLVFSLLAVPAHAYVGPGAGLSLLGALWALVAAIATALIFVIAWPIRRMRRRKREAKAEQARDQAVDSKADTQKTNVTRRTSSADDEKGLDNLQTQ